MITYKKMSLFDAPKDAIIIHACNSQGMWGSGIAKPFAENYPKSYQDYKAFVEKCNQTRGTACGLADMSQAHITEPHWVGWIVTSHNYSTQKDPPELIKIHTTLALQDLCKALYRAHTKDATIDVYSNKFNSGLFAVPWADSELILNTILKDFKRINWIVCDPEA